MPRLATRCLTPGAISLDCPRHSCDPRHPLRVAPLPLRVDRGLKRVVEDQSTRFCPRSTRGVCRRGIEDHISHGVIAPIGATESQDLKAARRLGSPRPGRRLAVRRPCALRRRRAGVSHTPNVAGGNRVHCGGVVPAFRTHPPSQEVAVCTEAASWRRFAHGSTALPTKPRQPSHARSGITATGPQIRQESRRSAWLKIKPRASAPDRSVRGLLTGR